jgi:hypothetical protein
MSQPPAWERFVGRLSADLAGGPDGNAWDDGALAMPAWLAQLVVALFDGQEPAAARAWAGRIQAELVRLGGRVPFAVLHDWHAGTVAPLLDGMGAPYRAVGALHSRALAGQPVAEDEWAAVLEPALREIYQRAYAYSDAYAVNYANAEVYGTANDFGVDGTREYATYYAELATGANLRAYADANAIANAGASAAGFVAADPAAYAEAYPYATVRAYAYALANAEDTTDRDARQRAAFSRLADGLANSLGRAEAGPEPEARPEPQTEAGSGAGTEFETKVSAGSD